MMPVRRNITLVLIALGLLCLPALAGASEPKSDVAPRMDIPSLVARIGSPDLLIVDVRTEKDLASSDKKIKGAVWEDSHMVDSWAAKYPREKVIVLYCA
jgi:hypothetical protein